MPFNHIAIRVSAAIGLQVAGLLAIPSWAQTLPLPTGDAPGSAPTSAAPKAMPNERGAINAYFTSGWSFGVPAVRALAAVPGVGTAISPEKTSLPAYNVGMGVRAWRFIVPFVEVGVIDTGKAMAQVGSFKSEVQADTISYHGGVRLVGSTARFRPFAQFGGGGLHQTLKGTFYTNGRATPATGSASIGAVMFGGGMQMFWGRRWGSVIGIDAVRLAQPMLGGRQLYSRAQFGLFVQSKSSIE